MKTPWRAVLILLALLPIGSGAQPTKLTSRQRAVLNRMVASQVSANVALDIGTPVSSFDEGVELSTLSGIHTAQVFRAMTAAAGHAPPLLLAVSHDRVFRLGGFVAPELIPFSEGLKSPVRSAKEAMVLARAFATVVDPNGAVEVRFNGDVDAISKTGGDSAMPQGWPSDTSFCGPSSCIAQLSVMSRRDWTGYGEQWIRIAYRFDIQRDGVLMAWSFRESGN